MSSITSSLKNTAKASLLLTVTATAGCGLYYRADVAKFFSSPFKPYDQATSSLFVYAVVQYTPPPTSIEPSKQLVNGKYKHFNCHIESTSSQDTSCFLYSFPSSSKSINLEDIKNPSNEVSLHSHLIEDKNYLIKLKKDFYKTLLNTPHQSLSILDRSNIDLSLGSFNLVSGLAKTDNNLLNIYSSSLFIIKLSETLPTAAIVNNNDTLSCMLGNSSIELPCQAYKLNKEALYSNTNPPTLTNTLTIDDLSKGKYLLIDLKGSNKTIKDVETISILLNKTPLKPNIKIATGHIEQVLMGSVNTTTPSISELLIVENAYSTLIDGVVEKAKTSFVLTKGGTPSINTQNFTYNPSDYLCSVIIDKEKYEDNNCKLYPFPSSNTAVFDASKFSEEYQITELAKLTPDHYQVVKLAKALEEKLKTLEPSERKIEIINRERASSTWNNKFLTLTYVTDMVKGEEAPYKPSSNLLLVRAKSVTETSQTLSTDSTLNCAINGIATSIPCKLYKFASPKTSNGLTPTEITSLSDSFTFPTDLIPSQYYALELIDKRMSIAELRSKTITLKAEGDSTELAQVTFDQLIFGKPKIIGALRKRKEFTYIVGKSGATNLWEDGPLPSSYRCIVKSNNANITDTFDYGCQLSKLKASNPIHKIIPLEDLRKDQTGLEESLNLKTDTENLYRLRVDLNKMYNINPHNYQLLNNEIDIESGDSTSLKLHGKVKLHHDITDEHLKTSSYYVLGKSKTSIKDVVIQGGKCAFDQSKGAKYLVECSIYKNSVNDADIYKSTFTTKVATADSFEMGKYFLFKLTTAQSIPTLKSREYIYFQSLNKTNELITFTIEGILGGNHEGNKNFFFLHKKLKS